MNKGLLTAAQVLAIISGVILCFFFILIIPLVFAILNFIAAGKIADYRDGRGDRNAARGWSIYLIFTTFWFLGGIFGLIGIGPDSESNQLPKPTSLEEKLLKLNSLYDNGFITKEEYDERRKMILDGEYQ